MTDLEIRPLERPAEFEAAVALQEEVWGDGFSERVPVAILRTAQRLGGVVSGAFDPTGRLIGFVFGVTGWRDGSPVHWSDMLAVRREARNRGIGEALKRHQREVLLTRGVKLVEWTFDPLESRNAWLNFRRLGALSRQYVRDYYGASDSPLHRGLGTDRLVVTWHLDAERVARRTAGVDPAVTPETLSALPVVNQPRPEAGGLSCDDARLDLDASTVLVAIPSDIQRLKDAAPALAARWRAVTRAAFEAYLPGRAVMDVVRAGGWSLLVLSMIDQR